MLQTGSATPHTLIVAYCYLLWPRRGRCGTWIIRVGQPLSTVEAVSVVWVVVVAVLLDFAAFDDCLIFKGPVPDSLGLSQPRIA